MEVLEKDTVALAVIPVVLLFCLICLMSFRCNLEMLFMSLF